MNINDYFKQALTYEDYRALLGEYMAIHKLHTRKFEPPAEILKQIESTQPLKILVITEPWCSDSLALIPVVYKLAQLAGNWNMKVILRDENPELIDQFRTNGLPAIPVFLFFNDQGTLLFRWGPRVKPAQRIFDQYREKIVSGEIEKQDVIKKIRTFYARDRGLSAVAELLPLVKKI
jgi:thiol-disulfide isomerase/thioredoxin